MIRFKNKIFLIVIIILSLIPIISLFHSGLPLTHDGQDHVARIANFYQNLTYGNIIPRWAENLNWGYGHPILEFLYPLPSYIASFFHFTGFSLVDSAKIVYGLGMILSLFFMYLWLSQFSTKYGALFGAVLYTYAPYRFVEVYVRGDIGENLAFAFIPLVLYFLYKLYNTNNYRFAILGGISLGFLVLSHNAISLMFTPFIGVYALLLLYFSKKRKSYFIQITSLMLLGFVFSFFFWFPALFEAKYTLRDIVTKGTYVQTFVSIAQLIYGPWSYGGTGQFTVQFGPFQWLAILLSPFALISLKKEKEKYYLIIILLIYTLISSFLMLSISNFIWSRILLLQNFQFTWRFLAIIVFSTAVLGGLVIDSLFKKNKISVITFSILAILFISSFYWHPKTYLYKPVSFYTGIYNGTTDTGESAPVWSIRFMEKAPKAHMEVIDGNTTIVELKRTSTYHEYKLTVTKKSLFEENTLYFPGWEILANGVSEPIQFQNRDYRGIMTFQLNSGTYIVEAIYKETKLRLFADIISIVSVAIVILFLLFKFVLNKLS